MRHFIEKVLGFVSRRMGVFSALLLLVLCFAFYKIPNSKFSENIFDLLPSKDALISENLEVMQIFKQSNTLYFNISCGGKDPKIIADSLYDGLKNIPEFTEIDYKISLGIFDSNFSDLIWLSPYLFTPEAENLLEKSMTPQRIAERLKAYIERLSAPEGYIYKEILLSDPAGMISILNAESLAFRQNAGYGASRDSTLYSEDFKNILIVARSAINSADSEKSDELMRKVEALVSEIESKFGSSKIAVAGAYRISADNAKIAKADSIKCLALSLICMVFLCLFAFRKRVFSLFALLPSLFGTLLAFLILTLVFNKISTICVGFASIAIGVSIDYAIHILYLIDLKERFDTNNIFKSVSALGKVILLGASTTILAFVIIFFLGSEGFKQLGLFGVVGVGTSAALSLLFLPILASKFTASAKPQRSFDKISLKFGAFAKNQSGVALFIIVFTTFASLIFLPKLAFEGNISSFSGISDAAKKDDKIIKDIWRKAVSKTNLIISADTLKEALRLNTKALEKLKDYPQITLIDSVSNILRDEQSHEANLQRFRAFWSERRIQDFRKNLGAEAVKLGVKQHAFDGFFAKLADSKKLTYDALLESKVIEAFKVKIINHNGKFYISTLFNTPQNTDFYKLRNHLKDSLGNAVILDSNFLSKHIVGLTKAWMLDFALLAFGFLFVYLLFALRSFYLACVVIVPVLLGLIWTFGLLAILGVPLTLINVIFIIFAVCIAEDYAVFLIHDSFTAEKNKSGVQSVLLSVATTIVGFGALIFAKHPVLNGLGLTSAISILAILLACILTVPLMLKFFKGTVRL